MGDVTDGAAVKDLDVDKEGENRQPDLVGGFQIEEIKNGSIAQSNDIRVATQVEPAPDSQMKSGSSSKIPVVAIVAAVVVIAVAIVGFVAVFGKTEVDKFVDYVQSSGSLLAEDTDSVGTDVTYELAVGDDGNLKLTMLEDLSQYVARVGNFKLTRLMEIDLEKDNPIAQVSLAMNMALDDSTRDVTSLGEININTYQFGNEVQWTYVDDTSNSNSSSDNQSGASELLENMIKQLQVFVNESDTGCTMEMLGFDSLS